MRTVANVYQKMFVHHESTETLNLRVVLSLILKIKIKWEQKTYLCMR